jgi:hypothetical protein
MPLRDGWHVLLGPLAFVVAAALWLAPMLAIALSSDDPAYRGYVQDILFHQTAGATPTPGIIRIHPGITSA